MNELEMLVEALGIQLEKERRSAGLAAFPPGAQRNRKAATPRSDRCSSGGGFLAVAGEPAGLKSAMHENPITRPIAELSADLRGGKLTSIDLLENALDRIAVLDRKLESFVCLAEDARAQAAAGDRENAHGRGGGLL